MRVLLAFIAQQPNTNILLILEEINHKFKQKRKGIHVNEMENFGYKLQTPGSMTLLHKFFIILDGKTRNKSTKPTKNAKFQILNGKSRLLGFSRYFDSVKR